MSVYVRRFEIESIWKRVDIYEENVYWRNDSIDLGKLRFN